MKTAPHGGKGVAVMRTNLKFHMDDDVSAALIRLNDALCTWERATGRQSVLILREEGGYVHRSASGKPNIPDDIEDSVVLESVATPSPTSGKGE